MKSALSIVFLIIVSTVLYALTLRGVYGNPDLKTVKNNLDQATKPFELSPERGRYALVVSLAENHSFALSPELADVVYPDVGYQEGRFYTYFPPGVSLLALPFYYVGKQYNLAQVGAYSTVPLFTILTLIVLFKIAYNIFKLPLWASLLTPFVFAFASTSWNYAITLYQHNVTTFFIFFSFYAVWKFKESYKGSASAWLWASTVWLSYGVSIWLDYPNIFLMLPVLIYFVISALKIIKIPTLVKDKVTLNFSLRPAFIATFIIFILLVATHGYYNYSHFGDWKRVSGNLVGYKSIKEQNLLDPKNKEKFQSRAIAKENAANFFKEENVPSGLYTLLIGIDKGILFFSPIFLLGLLGIYTMRKYLHIEHAILLSLVCINFFLYSSWGDPWGGWAFGPRYLVLSMGVFSLFTAFWVQKSQFTIHSNIITFLYFMYSSAISLLGALTTNAVPPKVEADFLHMKYNFLLNLDYLANNQSSSFLYNHVFSDSMNLNQYYLAIFIFISSIAFIILFVLPNFFKNEH